jgi:hypothetical protein
MTTAPWIVVLAGGEGNMTAANFSSDVLARAPGLAVDAVEGSGWSDWGSPRRVFEALAGTPDHDRLLARIRLPFTPLVGEYEISA